MILIKMKYQRIMIVLIIVAVKERVYYCDIKKFIILLLYINYYLI